MTPNCFAVSATDRFFSITVRAMRAFFDMFHNVNYVSTHQVTALVRTHGPKLGWVKIVVVVVNYVLKQVSSML